MQQGFEDTVPLREGILSFHFPCITILQTRINLRFPARYSAESCERRVLVGNTIVAQL